jgi:O-antigen ligase
MYISRTPDTNIMTPRPENKIVWPVLAAIAIVFALRNWSKIAFPPNIIALLAHLALAGASVLWAFKPAMTFQRFGVQVAILASIVLPILMARSADVIRGLFLCFGAACILNVFFVLNQQPILMEGQIIGYPGYFSFKGLLGECAAIALLLAFHEILYSGLRRVLGILIIAVALGLVMASYSKGSLGMAIVAPILAGVALSASRMLRISPALVLAPIPVCYWVLSMAMGGLVNRISWHLYGNYTLTGRTYIWDFVNYEIARKPLLGWGYLSFWLVGPDSPAIVEAPGWIKTMPHAHNGYLDTILDMGYVGLVSLVVFIFTTLYAIGRVADRDLRRAWFLLSLALFVILTNFLESTWMRGMDMLWLVFVVVAADAARYWQPLHIRRARETHRRMVHGAAAAERYPQVVTAAALR